MKHEVINTCKFNNDTLVTIRGYGEGLSEAKSVKDEKGNAFKLKSVVMPEYKDPKMIGQQTVLWISDNFTGKELIQ